ncbi:MAG: selenocysteine-specific translation elongation factor [Nitrospiraceae bacterium]|nr:MAG: selenocysteine-specific translation elongation factor [Nitrospiraceae bacterium]
MDRYVILGTAGHIDHGKSALVKALTGTDPDRLKEEKERGITIDLGFADLAYPDGLKVGIVDVPGHERLIKNMLAGAGGVDIVLMVIAADESIMPQSREHLDICNLLKVKRGMIVITKSDLVDADWIELITDDIRNFAKGTFLEDAGIIAVSSKTGHNIDLLKEKIHDLAMEVEPKSESGVFRLPVDRIFTLKGFGTVVTGTAVSGSISIDSNVEILPRGIKTKVRGLQSHGKDIRKAHAGQRVAMNLQGVAKEDVQRGDVVAIPEKLRTTSFIDADIEVLKNAPVKGLKTRSLVHFHTGTTELTGRVLLYDKDELKPGEKSFCQLRFKEPITVMTGDRYIVRRFSPLMTIGGGEILDVSPKRRKKEERIKDLEVLEQGSLQEKILVKIHQGGTNGVTVADIASWIKVDPAELQSQMSALEKTGRLVRCEGRIIHSERYNEFINNVMESLAEFHKANPLKPGMPKEAVRALFRGLDQRLFETMLAGLDRVVIDKDLLRLKSFKISLSEDKQGLKDRILKILEEAGFQPPSKDELAQAILIKPQESGELLKIMASEKSLVRINDSLYIPMSSYTKMIEGLQKFFSVKSEMTVGEFRDILKTSRKYALPFLEYLDSNKITLRVGEVRKFLKKQS